MLGNEIRDVTAARWEGLAGTVRTLTFTVGVRWWGRASEGSEQRRMLYFSGYRVLSGCRGRSPPTGVYMGSILGCGQSLVRDGDTGSALPGAP